MKKKQEIQVNVQVTYKEFERDHLKNVNPVATKAHMRRKYGELKKKK